MKTITIAAIAAFAITLSGSATANASGRRAAAAACSTITLSVSAQTVKFASEACPGTITPHVSINGNNLTDDSLDGANTAAFYGNETAVRIHQVDDASVNITAASALPAGETVKITFT